MSLNLKQNKIPLIINTFKTQFLLLILLQHHRIHHHRIHRCCCCLPPPPPPLIITPNQSIILIIIIIIRTTAPLLGNMRTFLVVGIMIVSSLKRNEFLDVIYPSFFAAWLPFASLFLLILIPLSFSNFLYN